MKVFDVLRSSCYYVTSGLLKSFLIRLQSSAGSKNSNFSNFVSRLYDVRIKKGKGSDIQPVIYDLYASGLLYVIAASFTGPNSGSMVNLNNLLLQELSKLKRGYSKVTSPLIAVPPLDTKRFIAIYVEVISSFLRAVAMDLSTQATLLISFIENNQSWFDFDVNPQGGVNSTSLKTNPYSVSNVKQLSNLMISQGKSLSMSSALQSLLNLRILQGTNFHNGKFTNSQNYAFTDKDDNLFVSHPNIM